MTLAHTPGVGFDAAADRYDADEEGNSVLAYMRERAFAELGAVFGTGSKLIELGSGTGTEAARLVRERECKVALLDPSLSLLRRASQKVCAAQPRGLLGAHGIPARSVGELVPIYGRASLDGAYSSFGPLNCEPSLVPVARGLEELVRPGGAVVLSVINRWCPVEVLWFALHGEWGEAVRRWGSPVQAAAYPGGPKDVQTWYYSSGDIARAFAVGFSVEYVAALPLLLPPPYLDLVARRFPRAFRALGVVDRWAAGRRGLRELGDHVLVRLRRR